MKIHDKPIYEHEGTILNLQFKQYKQTIQVSDNGRMITIFDNTDTYNDNHKFNYIGQLTLISSH